MNWEEFKFDDRLISVVKDDFKFAGPTPIQQKCIPEFLSLKDLIVEAPTGSGKTLCYAIPVIEILLKLKEKWQKNEVGALILAPNRELTLQIYGVFKKLLGDIKELNLIKFVGGVKTEVDVEEFKKNGCNIIVATPGRLEDLLSKEEFKILKTNLKSLEILIFDEADRLLDVGFEKSITSIMSFLPKQRRTSLFSATQTKFSDDLLKTGLRIPLKITLKDDVQSDVQANVVSRLKTPSSLKNFYCIIDAGKKFSTFYKFIKLHRNEKLLIFLSTCACVDYFGQFLKSKLSSSCTILSIHGKKKDRRNEIFDQFRRSERAVLLCTDVMARGVDIPSIDWVIQYDPPRNASFFVHRCGRTARCGAEGKALLFLTPSEEGYVNFLTKNQKVKLRRLNLKCTDEFASKMLSTVRKIALRDRSFLEKGSRAFVSFIQSYAKHDCAIVCNVSDLDVVQTAHSFGLIRLPRMPELRCRDLSGFIKCPVNTADIPYLDKKAEADRQTMLEIRRRDNPAFDHEKSKKSDHSKRRSRKRERISKQNLDAKDLDDIDNDYKLIKRLKKGKLSKNQFDEMFTE